MARGVPSGAESLGRHGEELAARYLWRQGMHILARNWRDHGGAAGEVDILARWGPILVAVEVKTRSGMRFGAPTEAVDHAKLERVRRLAHAWRATHPEPFARVRVDVLAVLLRPGGRWCLRHHQGVG